MIKLLETEKTPLRSCLGALIGIALILTIGGFAQAQVDCAASVSGSGNATYYEYSGSGGCDYPYDENNPFTVAMNPIDYDGSAMCGRYIRVTGPLGTVDVKIVDLHPTGLAGDIDLNRPAFEVIAEISQGIVPVTWETIADPDNGPISVHIKEGSNQWWMAVQPRNHRYGIAAVEYHGPEGFVEAQRQSYNYFVVEAYTGGIETIDDPFELRLTDVNGQTVVITGIPLLPGEEFISSEQFAECVDITPVPLPSLPNAGFVLHHPVPNPFNPITTLAFEISSPQPVSAGVFDISGRLVKRLINQEAMNSGRHEVVWNGRDDKGRSLPSGVYFLRVTAGSGGGMARVVLVK